MATTTQIELNVKNSFAIVKEDMTQLCETMRYVLEELRKEKVRHTVMEEQIAAMQAKISVNRGVASTKVTRTAAKTYVGSRTGKKVHQKACFFAKSIKPKNKRVFSTKNAALNDGYKACECVA